MESVGKSFEADSGRFSPVSGYGDASGPHHTESQADALPCEKVSLTSTAEASGIPGGAQDDRLMKTGQAGAQKSDIVSTPVTSPINRPPDNPARSPLDFMAMPGASLFAPFLADLPAGGTVEPESKMSLKPGRMKGRKTLKHGAAAGEGAPIGQAATEARDGHREALMLFEKLKQQASLKPAQTPLTPGESPPGILQELKAAGTTAAAGALGLFFDELRSDGDGTCLTLCAQLITAAREHQWLKDLLSLQTGKLKNLAASMVHGEPSHERLRGLYRTYSSLAETFPETVDSRLLIESVLPLLSNEYTGSDGELKLDASNLVQSCWKKDATLVKPTIGAILNSAGGLNRSMWGLIRAGIRDHGYEPGTGELLTIAGRIAPGDPKAGPADQDGSSLADALSTLRMQKVRHPDSLAELTMRGSTGGAVSLEQGIAERVISDPQATAEIEKAMAADVKPGSLSFVPHFTALISGSKEVEDYLLGILASEYAAAGSLQSLGSRGRVALALLGGMGPDVRSTPEVQGILSPELLKPQSDKLLESVLRSARADEAVKLTKTLAQGSLSAEKAFQAADGIISLGFCTTGSDLFIEPFLGVIRSAMKSASADPAFIPLRDGWLADVSRGVQKTGFIGEMTPEDIRKLYLLLVCARDDESLWAQLEPLRETAKDRVQAYVSTAHRNEARATLEVCRRVQVDKSLDLLREGNLPPAARFALVRENHESWPRLDQDVERRFEEGLWQAFLKGAEADYASPEMDRFMGSFNDAGDTGRAFAVIARLADSADEIPRECGKLLAILDGLPGGKERGSSFVSSSSLNEDGDYVSSMTETRDTRKMRKDLNAALSLYVDGRVEELLKKLEGTMTRPARAALMEKIKEDCHTELYRPGSFDKIHDWENRSYEASCRGISADDPSSFMNDLTLCFKEPRRAYDVYATLAPDAGSEADIGMEWQKFKGILEAMGGEKNFEAVSETYRFAREKEREGYSWETVMAHIYRKMSFGEDYREGPIRDYHEVPEGENRLDEFEDDLIIDGLRLKKRAAPDPKSP